MLTALFWKKFWIWLKHYWHWPVIIGLLLFSVLTRAPAKEKLLEFLFKQKESYEKELEIVKKTNEEKELEKNKTTEAHAEELKKIEQEHDLKLEELEEEKREELVRVVEENKDRPEKLAQAVAKILSAEYFKRNR